MTPAIQQSITAGEAGPVIKWVGGKTRLLPDLLAHLPASFGRYYEPFAGGAALFFRLAPHRAVLADSNADLVNLYATLAHGDVEELIAALRDHQERHATEHYYRVRRLWNEGGAWSSVMRAAAFVYLNKTCFNGLWRVNSSGGFNVPVGKFKSPPRICDPEALRDAAGVLARAELRAGHYAESTADAKAGDLVYFDPPYVPVSATSSFTGYTSDGFGMQAQHTLARHALDLSRRGVHVVLSNSDAPFVRALYPAADGWQRHVVRCGRALNSNASKRGDVNELVITRPPGRPNPARPSLF